MIMRALAYALLELEPNGDRREGGDEDAADRLAMLQELSAKFDNPTQLFRIFGYPTKAEVQVRE